MSRRNFLISSCAGILLSAVIMLGPSFAHAQTYQPSYPNYYGGYSNQVYGGSYYYGNNYPNYGYQYQYPRPVYYPTYYPVYYYYTTPVYYYYPTYQYPYYEPYARYHY